MKYINSFTKYIIDLYPEKSQFITGEPITMIAELCSTQKDIKSLSFEVKVLFLDEVVDILKYKFQLSSEDQILKINIPSKYNDFKGYGVDVYVYDDRGSIIQSISSSFDVVDSWRKSMRYGFLCDFYTKDIDDVDDVKNMRKLHINLVQFYDWMYRHDDLVPSSEEFQDLMGRTLNLRAVRNKVNACHEYGMKAAAYGAVYASSWEFYNKHKDWALYNSSGNVVDFIGKFYIMNVAKECGWHNHIINEYKKAVEKVNFDGIHMDTYGFPKKAISKLNNVPKIENLEEHFPVLINHTREELEKVKNDVCLIFNNVGNWPVDTVARAKQDAVYIEVWSPYERYNQLKQIIEQAKIYSYNKPIILAAYLKPFIDEAGKDIEKAHISALLATAVISANGAYHLIMGEKNGILTQGYYVDYSILDDDFFRIIRNYYDYIIRYLNVLFDDELRDVSMTHVCGDNLEYVFENIDFSTYGEANKVWTIIKEKPERKIIHFINLKGNDDYWNKSKNRPQCIKDTIVNIQIENKVKTVFAASPDTNMGKAKKLDYSVIDSERGKKLVIKIPEIYIWSTLVIEFEN